MKVSTPLISTIIPVYNGESYLREAIDSTLNQTYSNHEVIVIDDGSTDNTAQIAQSYSNAVKYHFQPNSGLSAARNTGVKRSRGDYLAFLDADDLFMPEKLGLQLECFNTDPTLDMVFGHVEQFYSPDLSEGERVKFSVSEMVMPGLFAGAMLVNRLAFLQAGYYDPTLRMGQFLDWYMKAKERGLKQFILAEVVVKRRIHRTNMSSQASRNEIGDFARLIKAGLDRRRGNKSE